MLKHSLVISACLLLALLPQQVASAAVEDCPEGSVCVWTEPEFGGRLASTDRETTACVPGVSRSGLNRADDLVLVLWTGPDCSGESTVLVEGQQVSVVDPPWRSVAVEKARKCLIGNLLCS